MWKFNSPLQNFDASNVWGGHAVVDDEIVQDIKNNNIGRLICTVNGKVKTHCALLSKGDGTYYVMVEAYSAINNISLIGSFEQAGALEPINRVEDNISVNTGDWQRYEQRLVAGYSSLNVAISGGTGDADLYLNFDAPSSNTQYVCRPYKNGNTETCTVSAPQAGLWYIDIKGYRNASGITLTINAE